MSSPKNLCSSCSHYFHAKFGNNREVHQCRVMPSAVCDLPAPTQECLDYSNRQTPSLRLMNQISWEVEKKPRPGFETPEVTIFKKAKLETFFDAPNESN